MQLFTNHWLIGRTILPGPSSDKLEEQLGELEQQFNDYTKLMESGSLLMGLTVTNGMTIAGVQ